MPLEYSFYKKSSKSKKNKSSSIKQIEITIKKNGVIRIELAGFLPARRATK